jgi:predicted dehydrogenase
MKKVGIIGGLGIGMAHAIACHSLGLHVEWISDIDVNQCLERYINGKWVNKWGNIVEEVHTGYFPLILKSITNAPRVDLIIIATPNSTHEMYAQLCVDKNLAEYILVEKPATLGSMFPYKNIFIGHKWLYADAGDYAKNNQLNFVCQFHNFPPPMDTWRRTDEALFDLGSHLLAYILHSTGNLELSEYSFKLLQRKQNIAHFIVTYRGNDIECLCGYKLYELGYESIKGFPTDNNVYNVEVILNDKGFGWKDDIFQKQIDAVINGRGIATCEMGLAIDSFLQTLSKGE